MDKQVFSLSKEDALEMKKLLLERVSISQTMEGLIAARANNLGKTSDWWKRMFEKCGFPRDANVEFDFDTMAIKYSQDGNTA